MKNYPGICLVISFTVLFFVARSQSNADTATIPGKLDAYLLSALQAYHFNGTALVAQKGQIIKNRGEGNNFFIVTYITKTSLSMINRRSFVKTMAASAAAGILPGSMMSAITSPTSDLGNIGVQLFSIPKLLEEDFAAAMNMLSQIGYKEVEFFGPYPYSTQSAHESWNAVTPALGFKQSGYFGLSPQQVKDILDKNNLSTPSMHTDLDTLRTKLNEMAEDAHLLGQQYVGLPAIPAEERKNLDGYKRIADEFNKIGAEAEKLKLKFFYHNHGYGLKEIVGKIPFNLILERTDPKLVYFEMDLYWTTAGGADPVAYLDANPGRFRLIHIKDMSKQVRFSKDGNDPQQWIELFPYMTDAGSGVLDLKKILSHAKKSGVEHFIVERDLVPNPKEALGKSYRYLDGLKLND